jgi:hypothetical protein
VTGYMFDKGVYFADMVSKSANYCFTSRSSPTGILMLCDVALGAPYERLQVTEHSPPPSILRSKCPPSQHSPPPSVLDAGAHSLAPPPPIGMKAHPVSSFLPHRYLMQVLAF